MMPKGLWREGKPCAPEESMLKCTMSLEEYYVSD